MANHHRQHNPAFKAKLVWQVLSGEKTPTEVCREHKRNVNLLNW